MQNDDSQKPKIFYTSDLHLCDEGNLEWNRLDGIAEDFASLDEYHDAIIARWNAKVSDNDIVYILGDIFTRYIEDKDFSLVKRLNGEKHLILGNHDQWVENNECTQLA